MLGRPVNHLEMLGHLADFKKHSNLDYDPGGWRLEGSPPRIIRHDDAAARLSTPWKPRDRMDHVRGIQ